MAGHSRSGVRCLHLAPQECTQAFLTNPQEERLCQTVKELNIQVENKPGTLAELNRVRTPRCYSSAWRKLAALHNCSIKTSLPRRADSPLLSINYRN